MKSISSLLLVVVSFIAGIAVEYHYGARPAAGTPLTMDAGTYETYSVKKAFDTQTGEPVYWVIGSPIKDEAISSGGQRAVVPVIQGEPKFYEVSRQRVPSLPSDGTPDPDYNYRGQILVR